MTGSGRRDVLGWLALAPLAAAMPLASAARACAPAPTGRFTLTRTLERELAGGAVLRVERDWSCRFEAVATGTWVAGDQTACRVSAPPPLAALAEIERRREITGFLPLALDAEGQIAAAQAESSSSIDQALAVAEALLRQAGAPGDRAWMAALGQTAAEVVSAVPLDLFFPEPGPHSFSREMLLPDGQRGRVTIDSSAEVDPANGLLIASTRQILTSAGGFSRRAAETWTLTPS